METLRVEAGALASTAAPPRVPDSRNAAVIYQQAFDLLNSVLEVTPTLDPQKDTDKFQWWDGVIETATKHPLEIDPADPRLRRTLAHLEPVLTLARRGAAMPDCYFERSWGTPSPSMLLGEPSTLRTIAEGLLVDAVAKAKEGRTAEALENVSSLFHMAAHLRQDPIGVSMMVSVAIDTIALGALEATLTVSKPTAAQLESFSLDRSSSYTWAIRRVAHFEQALGLAMFQEASASPVPFALFGYDSTWLPKSDLARGLYAALYRLFLLEEDLKAYREVTSRWTSSFNRESQYLRHAVPLPPSSNPRSRATPPQGPHILTDTYDQIYPGIWCAVGRGDATVHLARLAVAMAAYRAKHGAYPEKLKQLVPEQIDHIPIDPFDAQPLKMLRNEHGLVLYSIGPNKKDDRGATIPGDWRSGDITVRLKR
jgi:hypothetical protein